MSLAVYMSIIDPRMKKYSRPSPGITVKKRLAVTDM